jgi:DNA-binding PadR family transcriptional regulator
MPTAAEEKTTSNWMKEAQKGYIRIGVLILLNKKPSHGYEIMKEINGRTKGFWHPTAGGVYPILRDLEKSDYIKGEWQTQHNRKLKVYQITESGKLILKHAMIKQNEISTNIGVLFQEFSKNVLNVNEDVASFPNLPSFFTPFLEEPPQSEDTLEDLQHQQKHIQEAVKMMKERLNLIEKRIAEIKKEQTKTT